MRQIRHYKLRQVLLQIATIVTISTTYITNCDVGKNCNTFTFHSSYYLEALPEKPVQNLEMGGLADWLHTQWGQSRSRD